MTPPASDHFNGKTFFQPGSFPKRGFRDFLRWRMTSKPAHWPQHVPLSPQPRPPAPRRDEIVATWLGHASFLIQTARGNVLFDPVFSERVSPFRFIGPKRVHAVPLTIEALPRIDAVCISHDHYDHCDEATLRRLAEAFRPTFIAPLRHRDLLHAAGAQEVIELDWWQSHRLPGGAEIVLTPTQHWSNRFGTPRNHRLWGGFWMRLPAAEPEDRVGSSPVLPASGDTREILAATSDRSVWFVGDTGYNASLFAEISRHLGSPDLALVPIGAYEPRWFMAPMHMNPAEAVQLHRDVGAETSLAMHWGTFRLTDEARHEPTEALAKARNEAGISPTSFRVISPGESVVV